MYKWERCVAECGVSVCTVWCVNTAHTLYTSFLFFFSFLLSVNQFAFLRSAPLLPPFRCIVGSCSWALWFLTAGLTYQHAYGWKWKRLPRDTAKDAGVYCYPMTNYRSPNDAWERRESVKWAQMTWTQMNRDRLCHGALINLTALLRNVGVSGTIRPRCWHNQRPSTKLLLYHKASAHISNVL